MINITTLAFVAIAALELTKIRVTGREADFTPGIDPTLLDFWFGSHTLGEKNPSLAVEAYISNEAQSTHDEKAAKNSLANLRADITHTGVRAIHGIGAQTWLSVLCGAVDQLTDSDADFWIVCSLIAECEGEANYPQDRRVCITGYADIHTEIDNAILAVASRFLGIPLERAKAALELATELERRANAPKKAPEASPMAWPCYSHPHRPASNLDGLADLARTLGIDLVGAFRR